MMYKRVLAVTVFVFMFSFSVIEFAYSHPDVPKGTPRAIKYRNIKQLVNNKLNDMTLRKPNLVVAQSVISDINSGWAANEAAIKAGRSVTITSALNTLFSAIGAVATGGGSVAAQVAVTGPGFINAATTYASASKTDEARLKKSAFVKAFEVALSGYDAAIGLQKSDHDEYTNRYFEYFTDGSGS